MSHSRNENLTSAAPQASLTLEAQHLALHEALQTPDEGCLPAIGIVALAALGLFLAGFEIPQVYLTLVFSGAVAFGVLFPIINNRRFKSLAKSFGYGLKARRHLLKKYRARKKALLRSFGKISEVRWSDAAFLKAAFSGEAPQPQELPPAIIYGSRRPSRTSLRIVLFERSPLGRIYEGLIVAMIGYAMWMLYQLGDGNTAYTMMFVAVLAMLPLGILRMGWWLLYQPSRATTKELMERVRAEEAFLRSLHLYSPRLLLDRLHSAQLEDGVSEKKEFSTYRRLDRDPATPISEEEAWVLETISEPKMLAQLSSSSRLSRQVVEQILDAFERDGFVLREED